MKRRFRIGFRINDGNAFGQRRFWLMMIENDYIDTALLKIDNFTDRRHAAIDRDQKSRSMLLDAAFDAFSAQTVAFLHPQWKKQTRRAAISSQHFGQQRNRSYTIDIVIPEERHALLAIQRGKNSRDRRFHIRQ